jgi:hypothetical protein
MNEMILADAEATREDFWKSYDAVMASLTSEQLARHKAISTERN